MILTLSLGFCAPSAAWTIFVGRGSDDTGVERDIVTGRELCVGV